MYTLISRVSADDLRRGNVKVNDVLRVIITGASSGQKAHIFALGSLRFPTTTRNFVAACGAKRWELNPSAGCDASTTLCQRCAKRYPTIKEYVSLRLVVREMLENSALTILTLAPLHTASEHARSIIADARRSFEMRASFLLFQRESEEHCWGARAQTSDAALRSACIAVAQTFDAMNAHSDEEVIGAFAHLREFAVLPLLALPEVA
jgi:hypothetical protein